MPKGQKIVDWTKPENDKKLLHAIITASDIGVNYDKVAKAFGGGVPASCISLRISKIRKEVRGKGVTSTSTGSIPGPSQRKATTAWKAAARNNNVSDDTDDDLSIKQDSDASTIGKGAKGGDKVITGRITKARKSPRQSSVVRKDYQKMLDPYNDLRDVVDEDGDVVFDRQALTSEDSMDSDKEYGHERGAAAAVIEAGQSE
ncbi:MAG: hypothetical protein Q9204_005896, partial [Flavoplaca sp. TL-2023a]